MASKKKKQVLYPVFFMMLVTVVFVTVLALINSGTKDIITMQEELTIKENILYVLQLPYQADIRGIEQAYQQFITEKEVDGTTVYYATQDGANAGYAFEISGPGLWGSMTGHAGLDAELTHIKGVSFVSHQETPGLGGRVDEQWFKNQFQGIEIKQVDSVIFRPAEGGNIDAITGATLTSESVRKIVNEDIANFVNTVGGDL